MHLLVNGNYYEVIIIRKKIKHLYFRFDNDLKICVSAPNRVSILEIKKVLNNKLSKIRNMIIKKTKSLSYSNCLLGKKIDIIIDSNLKETKYYGSRLLVKDNKSICLFYKDIANSIFKERLDYFLNSFDEDIPYPKLKVKIMKSRWGVCNLRRKSITINLELIKREIKYLDYVIVHELCHFIYFNHSKSFWDLVSKYIFNYKELKKSL